ncbi:MAG: hypothetical protein AYK18_10715 [Theionarchaea archaeon DG-70]|nr:MAG: hypothetical protein AYK18_10715 [Theionarchaea archaeon DG-70]
MCIFTQEKEYRLRHCIHHVFLEEPRLHFHNAAKKCGSCRNTVSTYWRDGLKEEIFFPPQIRLKMYENRKEYIYLIQNDSANKLYEHYKKHPNTVYITYTSGKFDILLQTEKPLDVLPDRTIFHGARGNYIYPETPNCSYAYALTCMERLLEQDHSPSKIPVEYSKEPLEIGSPYYGWMIFPYVKRNLRTGYTRIVKKLHISSVSFYKGLEYLLNVSTKLLPYYPLGFRLYSQQFFVFWSDYEELLCKSFSHLPCHTSITKVSDALLMYVSIEKGLLEKRLLQLCFKMNDLGYINRFWSSIPIYHWTPDEPQSTGASPA